MCANHCVYTLHEPALLFAHINHLNINLNKRENAFLSLTPSLSLVRSLHISWLALILPLLPFLLLLFRFFFYILFGDRYIAIYEYIDPFGWFVCVCVRVCALMHDCIQPSVAFALIFTFANASTVHPYTIAINAFDPTDEYCFFRLFWRCLFSVDHLERIFQMFHVRFLEIVQHSMIDMMIEVPKSIFKWLVSVVITYPSMLKTTDEKKKCPRNSCLHHQHTIWGIQPLNLLIQVMYWCCIRQERER